MSPRIRKTEFKNILECESGANMGSIYGKNSGHKSRATFPLSCAVLLESSWTYSVEDFSCRRFGWRAGSSFEIIYSIYISNVNSRIASYIMSFYIMYIWCNVSIISVLSTMLAISLFCALSGRKLYVVIFNKFIMSVNGQFANEILHIYIYVIHKTTSKIVRWGGHSEQHSGHGGQGNDSRRAWPRSGHLQPICQQNQETVGGGCIARVLTKHNILSSACVWLSLLKEIQHLVLSREGG